MKCYGFGSKSYTNSHLTMKYYGVGSNAMALGSSIHGGHIYHWNAMALGEGRRRGLQAEDEGRREPYTENSIRELQLSILCLQCTVVTHCRSCWCQRYYPHGAAHLARLSFKGIPGNCMWTHYHLPVVLILTYLCPSLPVEHRPSTTPRHHTLFWAALVITDQLVPCCFNSVSVSRLQLLQGRPLFLFPCGYQVRAWRVVLDAGFLKVCPIQPHFLRSICLATGSCPARSHRSSFRIFSCHWIL